MNVELIEQLTWIHTTVYRRQAPRGGKVKNRRVMASLGTVVL